MEFIAESIVHGNIAFIDGDAETTEDCSDGAAIVEGAADDAEASVVDDNALVEARR